MKSFKQYYQLTESVQIADSVRCLTEGGENSLTKALSDFIDLVPTGWVLIGGLAVGFHSRPRGTQDIDVLTVDSTAIKLNHYKFIQNRPHSLEHRETGVEIELLDAKFLGIDPNLVQEVIKQSSNENLNGKQISVASSSGLVALKLQRGSRQDLADIEAILRHNKNIDISSFPVTPNQLNIFQQIKQETSS